MSTDGAANKPTTPRGSMTPMQVISGLFRTPSRLRTPTTLDFVSRQRNKRTRNDPASTLSSPSPRSTPSSTPCINPSLPGVVLQTYSVSTDSIVLTSLPSVPFCCHEDLLTMSRTQLEEVVRALNARLPRRMSIGPDTADSFWGNDTREEPRGEYDSEEEEDGLSRMSEAEMRRRIEELVGIRAIVGKNRVSKSGLGLYARMGGVPPAPKAVRTWSVAWRPYDKAPWDEMEVDADDEDLNVMIEDAMMGSSPLAGRTKSGARLGGRKDVSRLAILQEESEGSESDDSEGRPSKRQRVSSGSVAQNAEEERQTIQETRQSRLIENMDVSGSPLLAREDDTPLDKFDDSEEMAAATEGPPRRRSVRIKEFALKRASSVDKRKNTSLDAPNLKSSMWRSKTFSRRTPRTSSPLVEGPEAEKGPSVPRECTIRLPFTSLPPPQKSDSSAWSAPRTLRSHSQRLSNSSESSRTRSSLGRSQSVKYPRASDLAFVTINRPRYRFARRKSKGSKDAKGDQEHGPSASDSPAHAARQVQQDIRIGAGYEDNKENQEPKIITKNSGTGGLYTGASSSTFYSLLTPCSRAPSMSTIASTRSRGDPPMTVNESTASATITDTVVTDGPAVHVLGALERMVVDIL